jgi:hypothetical protein
MAMAVTSAISPTTPILCWRRAQLGRGGPSGWRLGGEKTALFVHVLYKNAIILPRQARDKHRESSTQKGAPFSCSGEAGSAYDRQYVCRMALFDSASGKLDAGGWTDITLKIGESETRNAKRSLCVLDLDSTAFGTS